MYYTADMHWSTQMDRDVDWRHSHTPVTPRVSSVKKNWEYDEHIVLQSRILRLTPSVYNIYDLCRIQGRQRSRQPQRHGRVQIPCKELKCRQTNYPQYLLNYCVPVTEVASRQHLRSATRHQLLLVPRCRRSTFGRRA